MVNIAKTICVCHGVLPVLLVYAAVAADRSPGERWETKARQAGITDIQRQAYKQLARVHECDFSRSGNVEGIDLSLFETAESPNPMIALRALGLDVLPILAEALDDDTPTKTVVDIDFRRGASRVSHRFRVWKVNELVARLVPQIAHHEFVLGEWGPGVSLELVGSQSERIPEFRKQIIAWYEENRKRTAEERRIADLDSSLRNRLDAASWLGRQKSTKAVPSLSKRIEAILGSKDVSSSTERELAACSLALGLIGDAKAVPVVTKACDHLAYWSPRWAGSNALQNLFDAYHGLAMLDQKKEALAELKRVYREHGPTMEPHTRKDYETKLSEAAKW
jgi:hypothetical protein